MPSNSFSSMASESTASTDSPSPPDYTSLYPEEHGASSREPPPAYSPSVCHLSVCYCMDESQLLFTKKPQRFHPVILEIDSTKLNMYSIGGRLGRCFSHMFDRLVPQSVDQDLNIKSSRFYSPYRARSSSAGSLADSLRSLGSSSGRSGRVVDRVLNFMHRQHHPELVTLKSVEFHSPEFNLAAQILGHRPAISGIFSTDFSKIERKIMLIKHKCPLAGSWSLQELSKYGNACDYGDKPFALRLCFPSQQFLLISYNPYTFVRTFYKLNVAHELSLDLDLRDVSPLDFCVPRRRHGRRWSHAHFGRNNSVATTSSELSILMAEHAAVTDQDTQDDDNSVLDCIPEPGDNYSIASEGSPMTDMSNSSSSVFSRVERQGTSDSGEASDDISASFDYSEKFPPSSPVVSDLYEDLLFSVKCIKNCRNKTVVFE